MTIPRFPIAKRNHPFATGGPIIRIHLPLVDTIRRMAPSGCQVYRGIYSPRKVSNVRSVPLVHEVYRQVARFHARPLGEKLKIKLDEHNVGYLPMR